MNVDIRILESATGVSLELTTIHPVKGSRTLESHGATFAEAFQDLADQLTEGD